MERDYQGGEGAQINQGEPLFMQRAMLLTDTLGWLIERSKDAPSARLSIWEFLLAMQATRAVIDFDLLPETESTPPGAIIVMVQTLTGGPRIHLDLRAS